ncbi:transposase [Burkholderia cepacia]|uniref:transposase n=1 Tax=Burkholderia cepacia TaxID=292 RepID=UPI001CF10C95|nr:transposase [Burkholderia cepacia]
MKIDCQRAVEALHVLHTGILWEDLPPELDFGSGMTCGSRLRDCHAAGFWDNLH